MTYLANIDGRTLKEMFLFGAQLLEHHKASIDALNVFPVPDGDTGTNMSLTLQSAVRELQTVDSADACVVADAISRGTLKGARGNSGVILSQLFRGFARGIAGKKTIDSATFAAAQRSASDTAYKALMKPKEGTILTVARAMAEDLEREAVAKLDLYSMLESMLDAGAEMLKRTPDMLPVLKQAGVVDAGGQGLLTLWLGFKMYLDGAEKEEVDVSFGIAPVKDLPQMVSEEEDITYAYCTETIIQNLHSDVNEDHLDKLRNLLSQIGDCVLVVGDAEIVKIHCHSNNPGRVLEYCLKLGELNNIKIENMRIQHRHLVMEDAQVEEAAQEEALASIPEPTKELGVVSVAAGEGLAALFTELLTDKVVQGGQTMNPSAGDIAKAILETEAKNVLVLPNNSNIILAAQQAALLLEGQRNVFVIPSKTVPQGVAAIIEYMPESSAEENAELMEEAIHRVQSGAVTYAVRESQFDGQTIHEGDILGLIDSKIAVVGQDMQQVVMDLLAKMVTDESSMITMFRGQDVTDEQEEALRNAMNDTISHCDMDFIDGGQPLYYYLFSVE